MSEMPGQTERRIVRGIRRPFSRAFHCTLFGLLLVYLGLSEATQRLSGGHSWPMLKLPAIVPDSVAGRIYTLAAHFGFKRSAATRPLEDLRMIDEPLDQSTPPATPEPR